MDAQLRKLLRGRQYDISLGTETITYTQSTSLLRMRVDNDTIEGVVNWRTYQDLR